MFACIRVIKKYSCPKLNSITIKLSNLLVCFIIIL